jgi:hypothetical protein
MGKFAVVPLGNIVVFDFWYFADRPFDEIAIVIENKDDWPQLLTCNLRDFLGS